MKKDQSWNVHEDFNVIDNDGEQEESKEEPMHDYIYEDDHQFDYLIDGLNEQEIAHKIDLVRKTEEPIDFSNRINKVRRAESYEVYKLAIESGLFMIDQIQQISLIRFE